MRAESGNDFRIWTVAFAAGATAVKQNSWCCRSKFCGAAWPWERPLEFCFSPPLATAGVDYRPTWAAERRHRFGAGTETCRTIEQSAVTRDPGVEGVDEGIPMTISKNGIGSLTPFFGFPISVLCAPWAGSWNCRTPFQWARSYMDGCLAELLKNVETASGCSKRRDNRCVGSIPQDTQS